MELVDSKYYLAYSRIVSGFAGVLLIASALSIFFPSLEPYGKQAGLSIYTIVVTTTHLVFFLTLHHILHKKSPWAAAFICCLFSALTIYNLMHVTGQLSSWWHLAWWLITLANGMFGYFILICNAFLTIFYYVIIHTLPNRQFEVDPLHLGITLGIIASCYVSYVLWKKAYSRQETKKIVQLSGLVKGKETESEIIIKSITDGIVVVNNESKVTSINDAAAKMVGWKPDEAIGIDVSQVMKAYNENDKDLTKAQPQQVFGAVLKTQKQLTGTMQLVGKQNTIYVSLVASPIIPEGHSIVGAVAVMRDITTSRAEEQKRADFISTASHEMRTPVAAIEGYLALAMNDKVTNIDQKARAYLEKAHSSTQHLGKLFQDLLTSAKAEDGRLVSHPVVIEMGSYLDQIADSLRFTAEKKGLLVEFTVGATKQNGSSDANSKVVKPLYYINADPDRLREVITNLFDNAVKYTETGKVSIALTGNNDVVQMYIKDTGPGIPAADVSHLFQKFYRVDNSSTRTIGGTGLGLFICKKIVELYKGRIWVDSKEGEGSTFYINLPRLSSQQAQEMQTKESQSASPLEI